MYRQLQAYAPMKDSVCRDYRGRVRHDSPRENLPLPLATPRKAKKSTIPSRTHKSGWRAFNEPPDQVMDPLRHATKGRNCAEFGNTLLAHVVGLWLARSALVCLMVAVDPMKCRKLAIVYLISAV